MATVNKDFKIKSGLIVEGTTATVNGYDVLTKKETDQDYIIDLIGGTATPNNDANAVVKRDADGNFAAGEITADLVGNVTGQVSDISNHDTNDLSEGSTNKYFTNQRAIDAQAGLWDAAGSAADAQDAAESYADGLISIEVTNRNSAIATAKSEAISTASDDATSKANAAENNAIDYTNSAISTEVTNRNNAIDDAISAEVTDRNNAIDSAITNLNLAGTYDALGAAADALADANVYTDNAVSDLVNSAPAMLDTLGELATALQDNPDIISDLQDIAAGKQGTLTTGNGIVIDNDLIYIPTSIGSGVSITPSTVEIDRAVVDTWYDASGAAASAQSNAEDYAEGLISTEVTNRNSAISNAISTEVSDRNSAISNAISTEVSDRNSAISSAISTEVSDRNSAISSAVNALTTDDIEEGSSNLYFEDGRAKTSAADLLTSANLTNITITGNGSGLTITAENGVGDSTTDDLEEGNNNLYFTNQRAVDALQAVTPQFQEVDITWATKQTAAYTYVPTASTTTVFAWNSNYASAKFLVRVRSGSHSQVSEVLVTTDNSNNVAITEYAMVGTNGNLGNVSATWNGQQYELTVATQENNSEVIVSATLMAYGD